MGRVFAGLHRHHGTELRLSTTVTSIDGDADGGVTGVTTEDETIPADIVVVGVGATPNTELAEQAGIAVEDGILCDASLCTDTPGVFAAGDAANPMHPVLGAPLRSEHWANARETGAAAARSMLGQPVTFDEIPYFFTDQYDLGMELSGYPPLMREARVVVRGDLTEREFVAFWVDRSQRVVAGMNVNVWDVNDTITALISSGTAVSDERLENPAMDLSDLADR